MENRKFTRTNNLWLFIVLANVFFANGIYAATITTKLAGPWTSAGNWDLGRIPAALSVKDGAVPVLLTHFPCLMNAQQFSFPDLNKNVRYIPCPIENNSIEALTQKAAAIIFVNYSTKVDFHFKKLDSTDCIQRFNQEAWISPSMGNAKRYLKWITTIPAYELTYSDTERALAAMSEIFDH